jgi:biopolymer transport protein ExbD
MARGHHYKKLRKDPPELDITSFLNLMVVLVPFLLISAVFSRMGILELNLPTAAGDGPVDKPKLSIEVIVREKGIEIGNGKTILVRFPKDKDSGEYDTRTLTEYLLKIKAEYINKKDATILMEPDIEYRYLVEIMDTIRTAVVVQGDDPKPQKIELFPDISIGDAP